jgi:hypothetical protein
MLGEALFFLIEASAQLCYVVAAPYLIYSALIVGC